mmetsp:Transcript_11225/g.31104  ORF Transcript_11225/g.31104 Transcript_11225/m.31104 type:complete len:90 (-) Transcript_11225:113-382(-)
MCEPDFKKNTKLAHTYCRDRDTIYALDCTQERMSTIGQEASCAHARGLATGTVQTRHANKNEFSPPRDQEREWCESEQSATIRRRATNA